MSGSIQHSAISLELLRAQLQSIVDEAGDTVIRTAISPLVNEGKDCGSVLMDGDGNLVAGGGTASIHWVGATRAIKATLKRYAGAIHDGDVFVANDPYNGGGLHPADAVVQRPIFVDGKCVAWVALSAHLMDMGGMAIGSWAPQATECYQEAFRIPSVRLIKAHEDVGEVWDLFRVNVRFSALVEMDVRSLVAGSFVAQQKLRDLAVETGIDEISNGIRSLIELSEGQLRRRIMLIEPGEYRAVGWTEWGKKFVVTPCRLTVLSDRLVFDFEGSDPQIPFFINSQPYIIKTLFMPELVATLAADLPFNEGLLAPIELRCPEGTVVHSVAPAPMNCGHMHLGSTAAEAMYRCLRLALWASPTYSDTMLSLGAEGFGALSSNSWFGTRRDGSTESWLMTDGIMTGGSAFRGTDGTDFTMKSLDLPERELSQPRLLDIESYEAWYPILMRERRVQRGTYGSGHWRSGAALTHSFEPYGAAEIVGQMLGQRGYLPLNGEAGGNPGAVTRMTIRRPDGSSINVPMAGADVVLRSGEVFELQCASAGGWGDPLDRDPAVVVDDVRKGRITPGDASNIYGVELTDSHFDCERTEQIRGELRRERLAQARPARRRPADAPSESHQGLKEFPLYPGVIQRGNRAYASVSGALLAVAPDHWTDGCPVVERQCTDFGSTVVERSYLDPASGTALYVETVPVGSGSAFASLPQRWTLASQPPAAPR